MGVDLDEKWVCTESLLLWIQNPRVHSSMVRAAGCRSAGPWFNSGWRSWFIFMTGSDNLMNHPAQRYKTMSPIRTVITTITRKSVNMVAELDYDTAPSRILDTIGQRLEGNSTVAKAATATAVALDTKARAAQGTVVQLKGELAQQQQSRTEAKVLHAIALKTPSDFGADTAAVRMPRRLMGLQVQEQHVRPDNVKSTSPDTENHDKNGFGFQDNNKNFIMTNVDNSDTTYINTNDMNNHNTHNLHK